MLVTGGCGFLGSHVCEYYVRKGTKVISYDNMTKHELERTGFVTEAARNYNYDYLKNLGVKKNKNIMKFLLSLRLVRNPSLRKIPDKPSLLRRARPGRE